LEREAHLRAALALLYRLLAAAGLIAAAAGLLAGRG
jgi:hypothetical protein